MFDVRWRQLECEEKLHNLWVFVLAAVRMRACGRGSDLDDWWGGGRAWAPGVDTPVLA